MLSIGNNPLRSEAARSQKPKVGFWVDADYNIHSEVVSVIVFVWVPSNETTLLIDGGLMWA